MISRSRRRGSGGVHPWASTSLVPPPFGGYGSLRERETRPG